jgi:hypothetical protein
MSDRARWKREDVIRWIERRLDVYVQFARALKDVYTLAVKLVAAGLPQTGGAPGDSRRSEMLALLDHAEEERTRASRAEAR